MPNTRGAGVDSVNALDLLKRWHDGDESAAELLYRRYSDGLIQIVRRRISAQLGRRIDAEDVVQSVYRSFFKDAKSDQARYDLGDDGDLWRLLVGMALKKLHRSIEFHTAAKRSIRSEDSVRIPNRDSGPEIRLDAADDSPPPDEIAALAEQLECVLNSLGDPQRRILELRLQGCDVPEIAAEVDRSERTVRRVLEQLRTSLEQHLR